ncbi:MAG: acyl-CoA dehydrogenase [Alphaproteobacteria bacterium]
MTAYAPPLRDLQFVLEELIGLDPVAGLDGVADASPETVRAILSEAGRFATGVLAPLNQSGDREGCRLENGAVKTPAGFTDAYRTFIDGGWNAAPFDPAIGGLGLPWMVTTALAEIWNAANVSFALCPMLTQGATILLAAHGNEAQKDIWLNRMVSGEWAGAMAITEPQAGSDVGAITTRAARDGETWRITGQKIFISWGEHDMADNIVHMVLARIDGAPGGTRGLSLFLAPKFLPGTGARNHMSCLRLEDKLGLHGSPTALMEYDGAAGWLVGEENQGISCMFTMMNSARLGIGHEGLGIAERAYQQARDYARERMQGRDPDSGAAVAILHHGDVRRMLLEMRCRIEAMRALCIYTAQTLDLAERHGEADVRRMAGARVELLTPIVKAWCSDQAVEIASLGIQIHGGAGYMEETGAAQYLRDARITPIYEGTNGIQALDLVQRKLGGDGGLTAGAVIEEMRMFDGALAEAENQALAPIRAAMAHGGGALARATHAMLTDLAGDGRIAAAGAAPYLSLFASVLGGYLLARSALIASHRLEEGGGDERFYEAKLRTARFYGETVLAGTGALEQAASTGAEVANSFDGADF